MRTVSAGLSAHLQQECTSIATITKITRKDGQTFFFTDHDIDIEYPVGSGNVYVSDEGYSTSAIKSSSTFNVDSINLGGFFGTGLISGEQIRQGFYDNQPIEQWVVNHQDLSQGDLKIFHGTLGEFTGKTKGEFILEMRSIKQALRQTSGVIYGVECRVNVGHPLCKFPISPDIIQRSTSVVEGEFYRIPTLVGTGYEQYQDRIYEVRTSGTTAVSQPAYNLTTGINTTDGTATLRAHEAFTHVGTVTEVVSNRQFKIDIVDSRLAQHWFRNGSAVWETGNNVGVNMTIFKSDEPVGINVELTSWQSMLRAIQIGDKIQISAGCNNTLIQCQEKFLIPSTRNFRNGNSKNYRFGFPDLPGQAAITDYPSGRL